MVLDAKKSVVSKLCQTPVSMGCLPDADENNKLKMEINKVLRLNEFIHSENA